MPREGYIADVRTNPIMERKMEMKQIVLAVAFAAMIVTAAGCARHKTMNTVHEPVPNPVLHTNQGEPISPERMSALVGTADYILLGEGHTNTCDHLGQATILRTLVENGDRPVVGLEMVSQDMQPVLDAWNNGTIPLSEIASRLEWKARWGHPFYLYKPVFEICRDFGLSMAALNIPRRIVDTVRETGMEGVLEQDQHYIPDPLILPPDEQRKALEPMLLMHAQMSKQEDSRTESFFLVQSLWDTAMAETAVRWRKQTGSTMVILAGAGHVENRWGIADRLAVLDPEATVVSVMPARDISEITPANADYYYLCPSTGKGSRLGLVLETRDDALVVKGVIPGSRAARAGFKPGDVLVTAGGHEITSGLDLHKAAFPAAQKDQDLIFRVLREGKNQRIVVQFQ
jgi:uncharacterized iron-regulated protein